MVAISSACVYCDNKRSIKKSNEHVISESVLKVAFGENIRNVTQSDILPKTLFDHEQKVKDICNLCNSDLSDYDIAGKKLMEFVHSFYDATNKVLDIDYQAINWLLKTHLNHMRIIPSKATGKYYDINKEIYKSIVAKRIVPKRLFNLYFEGWEGLDYFWDKNSAEKITYFSFRSVQIVPDEIVISNFRMKWLDTFLVLPSNNDYTNFSIRVDNAMKFVKANYNIDPERININDYHIHRFRLRKIVSSQELLQKFKVNSALPSVASAEGLITSHNNASPQG